MKRIFKNEIYKFIFSPIMIGFFVFPIILFAIVSISTVNYDFATALTVTTFVQILLITLFGYGMKIKVYQNETLEKKIHNSNFKKNYYIVPITLMYLITLLLTLLPIYLIALSLRSSLGYIESHIINYVSINSDLLENGLDKNYILFTSNWATFGQFIYACSFVILLSFGFAYGGTLITRDTNKYLVYSIILFIVLIITSGLLSKDLYILQNGDQYTRNSNSIGNDFFNFITKISPFYWAYQLLACTIIADQYSGVYIEPNLFSFDYYNIFHIGVYFSEDIDIEIFTRPILYENIELFQLLIVSYVPIFATSLILTLISWEVFKKW